MRNIIHYDKVMKYIDSEKLIAEIGRRESEIKSQIAELGNFESNEIGLFNYLDLYDDILSFITSLQQDKEALELEMCAEYWWEERGWIMIPPNTTLKGIESLLEQIKKKLQQEQPEVDLEKEIDEYFALWRQGASDEGCFNANSQLVSIYDCYRIAHHFYELGRNARKEE